MNRVWKTEFVRGAGDTLDNLTRRHVEVFNRCVHAAAVALAGLPRFDTARVHDFGCVAAGRVQQPRDVCLQLFRFVLLNLLHDVVVVTHQYVEAFVDDRRVVKFFVSMPGHERRDGGVERRCVTKSGVQVAGGECAGHTAGGSGPRVFCSVNFRSQPFVVRHHFASHIHFRPGNVAVHIDTARHHDHAAAINGLVSFDLTARLRHDASILDPNITDVTIDAVFWVVNTTVLDVQQTHSVLCSK